MLCGNVVVPVKTAIYNQVTMSAQALGYAGALSHIRVKSCMTDQCNGNCKLQPGNSGNSGHSISVFTESLYGDFGYNGLEKNLSNFQMLKKQRKYLRKINPQRCLDQL